MKNVIEKTRPAHVFGGCQESPEKRMGVYIESIMVKMESEVIMGLYRKVLEGGKLGEMNIKYLNTE